MRLIIVIDDGSTDDTIIIIKFFSHKVKYIRKAHGGLANARNLGLSLSRGDFIAWLDSDDIAHPDRFMIQASPVRETAYRPGIQRFYFFR